MIFLPAGLLRSELGTSLLGAAFSIIFILSFLTSFIQYLLIRASGIQIRTYLPEAPVKKGSRVNVRYEGDAGFYIIPFVIVSVGILFRWKNRVISGEGIFQTSDGRRFIPLNADARGKFSSDGASLRISDAVRFFRFEFNCSGSAALTVTPEENKKDDFLQVRRSGGDDISRSRKKSRNSILVESRQYFPGDDVRRINWKAYAHLGELLVRIGEEIPEPESFIRIIPDLSCELPETIDADQLELYLEHYVSALVQLTGFLKSRNISYVLAGNKGEDELFSELWWNDSPVYRRHGKGGLLLVSTAFSSEAETFCRRAGGDGQKVSVFIVSDEGKSGSAVSSSGYNISGLLKQSLFIADAAEGSELNHKTSGVIKRSAAELAGRLRTLRGITDAEII